MISLIMPAKNASAYIADAIGAVRRADARDWELIVVEDHSSDNTYAIAEDLSRLDGRVRVVRNPSIGKVAGLSFGYSICNGDVIKCIDADDVLQSSFFEYADIGEMGVMCHDTLLVSDTLSPIARYVVNPRILNEGFDSCLRHLISLPRCVWTFGRALAEHVFPLPEQLPFEDVWFSMVLKRFAPAVRYVSEPLYLYRQHSRQTYGGILNIGTDKTIFRAKRMLGVMDVLEAEGDRLQYPTWGEGVFDELRSFYQLLAADTVGWREIGMCPIDLRLRVKALLYRKLNGAAAPALKLKWRVDRMLAKP
jgi:glycosyltransferase involved in cell wall biosynthesis